MVVDVKKAVDRTWSDADNDDLRPASYAPGLWRFQLQGTEALIEARLSPPRLVLGTMLFLLLLSTALIFVGPGDLFWFFLFFAIFMAPATVGVVWLYIWEARAGDYLVYDQRKRMVHLPREDAAIPINVIRAVRVEERRGLRSGKLCQVSLAGVDVDGEFCVHVVSERIFIRSLNQVARRLAAHLGVPVKMTIHDETGIYER